jgi:hypothetical protein
MRAEIKNIDNFIQQFGSVSDEKHTTLLRPQSL